MVFPRPALSLLLLCTVLVAAPCAAETVLLDFSSASCGPCQQMRPIVHQLAAAGYNVREVSIDREPQLAARFGITQVPTFIVMVDEREAARLTGTTTLAQLRDMMERSSSSASATRAPVVPLGQSPDAFAPPAQDLSVPQPGRILAIEDPNPPPRTAPRESANPFAAAGPAAPAAPPTTTGLDERRFLEATVKVSIQDPDGTSAGTGTMVDSRSGEALVLTCGHLFRSSGGKGPITVTLYQVGPAGAVVRTTTPGNLIDFDLDRDLALISIRTEGPVQTIPIAPKGVALSPGGSVTTVGCNNGANPTAIASRITTVDRYQGHPNVQVSGAPVEGRSGGGLFSAQGQLIGVCNAADPQDAEGLYASLPSIHAKLDSLRLAMVYETPGGAPQVATNSSPSAPPAPPVEDMAVRGQAEPVEMSAPAAPPIVEAAPPVANISASEQATLQEIQRRGSNAEVICIIRPHSPDGKSEVITLHNASPAFVQALSSGAGQTTVR